MVRPSHCKALLYCCQEQGSGGGACISWPEPALPASPLAFPRPQASRVCLATALACFQVTTGPGKYSVERAFNPHPGHSEEGRARGRAEAGELAGGGRYAGALPAAGICRRPCGAGAWLKSHAVVHVWRPVAWDEWTPLTAPHRRQRPCLSHTTAAWILAQTPAIICQCCPGV